MSFPCCSVLQEVVTPERIITLFATAKNLP